MNTSRRIDVHHHIIPELYRDALDKIGIGTSGGLVLNQWTPEDSIAHMDALGVETAICSISEPALYPFVAKGPQYAKALARELNEYMAGLHEMNPARFGAFAVLPMPDVEASLEEIAYALDVLKLDGVGLLSNYNGQYLGDRVFAPVFDALQKRKACVYVHPSVPPDASRPEYMPLDYFAEFCFNTTRAAANMAFGGTMERCPDIKPIFSHMGGTLPYLSWRLSVCFPKGEIPKEKRRLPEYVYDGWGSVKKPVEEYFAQYYYDTALATHQTAFEAVGSLAPGHTLFGSDAFYAGVEVAKLFVKNIEAHYTGALLDDVNRRNAERLFPRFAEAVAK